jgi:hypothetical protein
MLGRRRQRSTWNTGQVCGRHIEPPVFHVEHADGGPPGALPSRGSPWADFAATATRPTGPTPGGASELAQSRGRLARLPPSPLTCLDQLASSSAGTTVSADDSEQTPCARPCPHPGTSRGRARLSRPAKPPGHSVTSAARPQTLGAPRGASERVRMDGTGQVGGGRNPMLAGSGCPRLLASWPADLRFKAQMGARCGCSTWNSAWATSRGQLANQRADVRTVAAWRGRRRDAGTGPGTGR